MFDGDKVRVVRNRDGANLTPSVVRIDRQGRVSVGHKAAAVAERDPNNVRREFKRLMGMSDELAFPAAGLSRSPEQLSALVLQSLREDVQDVTGTLPSRAVISVPALFELPQNKATATAAQLAGFEHVELLQEPIASALAAGWTNDQPGAWMVYDLGGGTFDVSLLETRDGLLRVVGHDGDNFLGGRDFDRAIVDWAVASLNAQGSPYPRRENPNHAAAFAVLRRAAEMGKIELSRLNETALALETPLVFDSNEVEVDLSLDRATLERLCAPLVQRTIDVCRRLLAQHGLRADQLSRIVLVGGPSLMPMVRRAVEQALETPIATGHDPMTLVAEGAALYAATAGLDSMTAPRRADKPGGARVWCQYPPVTADLEPSVIGRFEDDATAPMTVELLRVDADGCETWRSATITVEADRSFVASVVLAPRKTNRFRIVARSESGAEVAIDPDELSIIHGITIGDPPLSRTTGVALANDQVQVYFDRGTALPARRTFTHHTVDSIAPGATGTVLSIPIVQGEFDEAHMCRIVGRIEISGAQLKQAIPAGTAVEVTIVIDRGGKLAGTARVTLPSKQTLQFDGVAQLVMPEADAESLRRNLATARERCDGAIAAAFRSGDSETIGRLQVVQQKLASVEPLINAVRGGDRDAGQRGAIGLLDADAALNDIETEQQWPEFEDEARDAYAWAVGWVGDFGTPSEQSALDKAGSGLERALERRSVPEANRQLLVIRRLGRAAAHRHPKIWEIRFENCISRLEETTDLGRAKKLEARGRKAIDASDNQELRSVVEQMWDLFPIDAETRRMGFDSGVR
ncbi:MAG: Hsp70 family protein [Kofleriaceae bacterium]